MWWINCGILCWCRVSKFAFAVAAVVVGIGGPGRGDFHTVVLPLARCPAITTRPTFDNGFISQTAFFFFSFLFAPPCEYLPAPSLLRACVPPGTCGFLSPQEVPSALKAASETGVFSFLR